MQNVLNQIPIEYTAMAIDYLRNRKKEEVNKKKIVLSSHVLEHMSQFEDPGEDVKSLKAAVLHEEYNR